MVDYKLIFEAVEKSLFENSNNPSGFRKELSYFDKVGGHQFTDEEFYEITLVVVFASGFKASTMSAYHPGLRKYFPNIATGASYGETDIERIAATGEVIGNKDKLLACVSNARMIQKLIQKHGSMHSYIYSFGNFADMKNVIKLRADLIKNFEYIGDITSFHLMTDLGLPVLKPDRVIMRIFERLGLLYDKSQIFEALKIGQEFAKATGHRIRYIDIVFVSYGQVEVWGSNQGICLEEKPRCDECDAKHFCEYYKNL